MRPDEMLARRLARELEREIEDLTRLGDELHEAPGGDDTYSLRARGSILHDFYSGIERVLIRIAEELNGGVPRGAGWHRQLLEDMELEIPDVRPAVVSHGLREQLNEFLRFLHVYGFVLQAERMATLEQEFDAVPDRFVSEMRSFVAWMLGR